MIYSSLEDPSLEAFEALLVKTRDSLERAGRANPDEMRSRAGVALERVVLEHMTLLSRDTPFEGTINLISGHKFPDIVARKLFGVEVKSSLKNFWQTIGNSVNESTRPDDIETIYIMFGQLQDPISFRTRRYQDCLSDIKVTHYPRYWIDMDLREGQSIFDKMRIPYDELRALDDPFTPIRDYYRGLRKPGEELWWIDDREKTERALSPVIRALKDLSIAERDTILARALAFFPAVFWRGDQSKYNHVATWLVAAHGVVCASLRDIFSAGGQRSIILAGSERRIPAVFGRAIDSFEGIKNEINQAKSEDLQGHRTKILNLFYERCCEHPCHIFC